MFDALSKVVLPQVPQRAATDHVDPAVPILGMVAGMSMGYASRGAFSTPKSLIVGGALVWASAFAVTKISFGEPHDYFGRDNAPNSTAIGMLSVFSALGSTWAFEGILKMVRGK